MRLVLLSSLCAAALIALKQTFPAPGLVGLAAICAASYAAYLPALALFAEKRRLIFEALRAVRKRMPSPPWRARARGV